MTARQIDALSICKSVLDSGSRNVDIYWKLASSQYQDGQQELASKTLNEALSLHPGNSRLVSLQEIIAAASTEQKLIIRSSKVNQDSLDKGAVKIACLTKSGAEAINACQKRLELTSEDGDRIRARLALLESQQAPIAPAAVATAQPTLPPVQPTVPVIVQPTAGELAVAERRNAYRVLVAEVQTTLNDFGFNVGSPDGVSGGRTRNALSEFYTAIGAPVNTSISAATLDDLTTEKRKLANAKQLLRQSEQSIQQGNSQLAEQQLVNAKIASKLLEIPIRHEQAVRTAQIETLPVRPTTTQIATQTPAVTRAPVVTQIPRVTQAPLVTEVPRVTPTPAVTQTTTGNSVQQFSQLMGQINILQGKIRRKQADQAQQLDRMRNVL
ncbi:MAG: hypothetical protein ACJAY2_000639 [Pseudomonadales bacterium]|jgi:hypothetical protein